MNIALHLFCKVKALGAALVVYRTYDREVMCLTPGWVAIKCLLLGWGTLRNSKLS